MKVIKDLSSHRLRILVFGKNGVGKTYLSHTMPGKKMLLACEEGYVTLNNIPKDDRPTVIRIETVEDLQEAYNYLEKNKGGFDSIIVDTVTFLQAMVLSEVTGNSRRRTFSEVSPPSKRAWGELAEIAKSMINRFNLLPLNILYLTQEKNYKLVDEDEEEETICGPDLIPSIRTYLKGVVDVCARLQFMEVQDKKKVSTKRTLLLSPKPGFDTKTRLSITGVIPADLNVLYKSLKEVK